MQSHITESLAQFRADKIKAAAEDGRPIPADSELEAAFQIEWQNARIFTYGMPPLNTLRFDNSPLHAKWLKRDRHTNEKWIDSAANDARRLVKFYSQFPESFYAICKSAECLLFLDAVPELKRRFGIAEQHIAKGD